MNRLFKWFRPKTDEQHFFIDVFKEFIDKLAIENNLSPDTTKKHQAIFDNIHTFLLSKNLQRAVLTEIKVPVMEALKFWLHSHLVTCTTTHSARHIEMCKRVLRYATVMGYMEYSPIEAVKTKRDLTKEVIHLEANEITKMTRRTFASDIYNVVTDLYLFQCFTGLSYADLWSFEIILDGRYKFITSQRHKTGKTYCTEYTDQANVILRRYDGKLPKITNQQYNRVLKEIALMLNIRKNLTTHTARKTFATIKNSEGFTIETIADMMGNTPDVARRHYIKGSRERLKNELERLRGGKLNIVFN